MLARRFSSSCANVREIIDSVRFGENFRLGRFRTGKNRTSRRSVKAIRTTPEPGASFWGGGCRVCICTDVFAERQVWPAKSDCHIHLNISADDPKM